MGENFRFGAKARGDPQMLASREEFETRVVPLVEVDGEIVSSTPGQVAGRRGRGRGGHAVPGRAVPARGDRGRGGRTGPQARLSDRQHRAVRRPRLPGPRGLRGVRRRPAGGRQRGRSAHLRDRTRTAGRGAPDRLRRGPVRAGRCGSRSSAGCAANGGSQAWRSWSPRCIATSRWRESSVLASLRPDDDHDIGLGLLDAADQGPKAGADRQVRPRGGRYGLRRGAGGPAHGAHQPPDRAPARRIARTTTRAAGC